MNKVFYKCSTQEILNIIEALTLYKKLAVPKQYQQLIDKQLESITTQLTLQNIDIYSHENTNDLMIGDTCIVIDNLTNKLENDYIRNGIIIGNSSTENFYKVIVPELINNNLEKNIEKDKIIYKDKTKLEIIDVPKSLIEKVKAYD